MLLRVTREAGMLYEEMLTHCAQNVYNLTTFYKHQHFIHQECFIQKGILKTTKKSVALYSYFVNCCIITIGEQIFGISMKIFIFPYTYVMINDIRHSHHT